MGSSILAVLLADDSHEIGQSIGALMQTWAPPPLTKIWVGHGCEKEFFNLKKYQKIDLNSAVCTQILILCLENC